MIPVKKVEQQAFNRLNKNPRNSLLKQVSGIFTQFVHMLNYPIFAILFLKKENTLIYYVNHSENS
jgi:hypothetical protein